MNASPSHGAFTPDTPMHSGRMSLRDIRDYLDRVEEWVTSGMTYADTMEFQGEFYSGKDMVDDARLASSELYLLEKRK